MLPRPVAIRKKVVVVGDGACGKTRLLISMSKEKFNESYVTTVQNYTVCVTCDATRLQLALWDTACRDEYEILRPLSYSESDAILLCFSIGSPNSLDSVSKKWKSELLRYCKRVPVILVGCKLDLRSDFIAMKQSQQKLEFVSEARGIAAARSLKACCYLECSAKTGQGVKEVLQVAARESLRAREKKKKRCIIM